jgi:hypothetical protein
MTDDRLEPAPLYPGRVLDARLHLLDRQVLDSDGVPVTTLDDLEIEGPELREGMSDGKVPPRVTALLSGNVLVTRVFGGRPPSSRLQRIDIRLVSDVGIVISIAALAERLDLDWTERWFRDHIVTRIPGGSHDPG